MNEQQRNRLEFLIAGPCVPIEYIREYYGLTWPFHGELDQDYRLWKEQSIRRSVDCGANMVNRFQVESFMLQKRVLPRKWMAARLGMKQSSFDNLADRLSDLGLRPQRYLPYSEMVAAELDEDIVSTMRGLRFRTFSDHDSFCVRLHESLKQQLNFDVEPEYCATSSRLAGYPRLFARHFDCITLEPLSVKHLVWLDFHKPLVLEPDRCSKLLYAENYDVMKEYRAGVTDPPDLDDYMEIVRGVHHE